MKALEISVNGLGGVRAARSGFGQGIGARSSCSGFGGGVGGWSERLTETRPCPGDPTRSYNPFAQYIVNPCTVGTRAPVPAVTARPAPCCADCASGSGAACKGKRILPWALGGAALALLLGGPWLALFIGLLILAVPFLAKMAAGA